MNYKFHNKRYFNHLFMIPSENYIENLRKFYLKYGSSKTKSLKEFKRLALMEAKKVTQIMGKVSKELRLEVILAKELVIKVLQSTYDSINNLFIRINYNYKNERRKAYDDSNEYLDIIKKYEHNKQKLFKYTVKNICKSLKIEFNTLQKSVFHYLEKEDIEISQLINKASSIGKHFAIAPHCLSTEDIIEILEKYHTNLKYIIVNENNNNISKYAMIIICDIIYEYFGLEEEQIFSCIKERTELSSNSDIIRLLDSISDLVSNNLNLIYEL